MNLFKLFCAALVLFYCAACTFETKRDEQNQDLAYQLPVLPDNLVKGATKVSSLIDTAVFLQLGTIPDQQIGYVDKAVFYEDRIYVLDKEVAKNIFVFDQQGQFLFSFGGKEKAFAKYHRPEDFLINNGQLLVLDGQVMRIHFYDLATGQHLKTENLEFTASHFARTGGNYAFVGTSKFDKLIITDARFKVVTTQFPYNEKNSNRYPSHLSVLADSSVLFRISYCDSVFKIRNREVATSALINFGTSAFTYKDLTDIPANDRLQRVNNVVRENFSGNVFFYSELPNQIYFTYLDRGQQHSAIYHQADKRLLAHNWRKLTNDVTYGENPPLFCSDDPTGYLIGSISAEAKESILAKMASMDKNEYATVLSNLLGSIDASANPILYKIWLK